MSSKHYADDALRYKKIVLHCSHRVQRVRSFKQGGEKSAIFLMSSKANLDNPISLSGIFQSICPGMGPLGRK